VTLSVGEDVAREGILQAARLNALMAMIRRKKFLGCWDRIMGGGDRGAQMEIRQI